MININVRVDGVHQLVTKLSQVKGMLDTYTFNRNVDATNAQLRSVWRNNVYRYFNTRISMGKDVSGQLGGALAFTRTQQTVNLSMGPIFHSTSNGTWEYGEYLRKGVRPTEGKRYYPLWDVKIRGGMHPGFTNSRWISFMAFFAPIVEQLYVDAAQRTVREVVGR